MGNWAQTRAPRVCYFVGAEVLGDEKFHSEAVQVGCRGEGRALEKTRLSSVYMGFPWWWRELRQTGRGAMPFVTDRIVSHPSILSPEEMLKS